MIAPSNTAIEAAQDTLKDVLYQERHREMLAIQDKEIHSACPGRSDDFYEAYALGVQTARTLLLGMPNAVANKVEL